MKEYPDHLELHNTKGTPHYEVVTLIPKENEVSYTFFDTVNKNIITDSYYKTKKTREVKSVKINVWGMLFDEYNVGAILNDGTKWNHKYYSNWILNGDKTHHSYQDPLTEEEKQDPKKWLKKFKKLYANARYVYIDISDYYFKIKKEWFYIESASEMADRLGLLDTFSDDYPPKEDQDVRMVKLKDRTPDFFSAEAREANRDFLELVAYQPTESKKGTGINPIEYSAGYYIINVHLPKGDTLKIRHFGSMYPNLKTYKIPREYGGKPEVLFLIQEPNQELFPDQQWGGMYVIRPRSSK